MRLVPVALLCLLTGCGIMASKPQVRGNKIDPEVLGELQPNVASRADVQSLLGSPTAKATFDENTWIYIGGVTRSRVGQTQTVMSQDVYVISFDQGGVMRGIQHLTQDDRADVSVVARATPSPGSEASVMQQLFGNIGRFTPGGVGSGGGTSGGAN